MLESAEAFRHLDEILSIDGIDAVTLGPTDLAQELGVFGTPRQAAVLDEHRQRLIDAARATASTWRCWSIRSRRPSAGSTPASGIIAYSSDVAILRTWDATAVRHLRQPVGRT